MLLISLTWAIFEALSGYEADTKIKVNGSIALCGYLAVSTVLAVAFNIALLRYVLRQRKNSFRHQVVNSNLKKTVVMIILLTIAAYSPLLITVNMTTYGFVISTDKSFTQEIANRLLTAIPCQVNAVLNSVTYLSRSSRMKRYCYKLFNCETVGKCFKRAVFPVPNITQNGNKQSQIHSIHAVKAINRRNDL